MTTSSAQIIISIEASGLLELFQRKNGEQMTKVIETSDEFLEVKEEIQRASRPVKVMVDELT